MVTGYYFFFHTENSYQTKKKRSPARGGRKGGCRLVINEIKDQLELLNESMKDIHNTLFDISDSLHALVKVMILIYRDI